MIFLERHKSVPDYVLDSLPQSFSCEKELYDFEQESLCDLQQVEFRIDQLKGELGLCVECSSDYEKIKAELSTALKARRWKRTAISVLRFTRSKYASANGKAIFSVRGFEAIKSLEQQLLELRQDLSAVRFSPKYKHQIEQQLQSIESRLEKEKRCRLALADRFDGFRQFCLRTFFEVVFKPDGYPCQNLLDSLAFVKNLNDAWGRKP